MKIVLKSLPHLPWMITLVGSEDIDMSLKGDLQAFSGEERTIRIVPGAILEQLLCDCFRINDDYILS